MLTQVRRNSNVAKTTNTPTGTDYHQGQQYLIKTSGLTSLQQSHQKHFTSESWSLSGDFIAPMHYLTASGEFGNIVSV